MTSQRVLAWLVAALALVACGDDDASPSADAGDGAIDASQDGASAGSAGSGSAGNGSAGDAMDGGDHEADAGSLGDGGNHDASVRMDASSPLDAAPDARADADADSGNAPAPFAVRQIAVGFDHACAIDDEGALFCFGNNDFGQLGTGDMLTEWSPARVGSASDWEQVAAGRFHSCGIRADGELHCWGASLYGQAGAAGSSLLEPSQIAVGSERFVQVTTGDWHSCALTDEGDAYCFGFSLLGRLGDGTGAGTVADPGASVATPVRVDAPEPLRAIAAGAAHTCAIDAMGVVSCWGSGARGELGTSAPDTCTLSSSSAACALRPVLHADVGPYASVSAGNAFSCAVRETGQLLCWGDGEYGRLGTGGTDSASSPVAVGDDYRSVSCGAFHACALRSDGALVCFGDDGNGQLGRSAGSSSSPVPVELSVLGAVEVDGIAAGGRGSCAWGREDGVSFSDCWGISTFSSTDLPSAIVPPIL